MSATVPPETTGNPGLHPVAGQQSRAPLALAAAVTTTWAAMVSLIPTVIIVGFAYAVDSSSVGLLTIVRLGLAGWIFSHGVPVHTGLGPIGLTPLLVTAFAAWRVIRAGVHTARAIRARRAHSQRRTLAAGCGVGLAYGLIGLCVAAVTHLPGVHVPVLRAAATLAAFGLVCGLIGAAAESGMTARWISRTPVVIRDGARTGSVATLLLFGAGAGAAGLALALAGGDASQVLADYRAGFIGQAGLTLICLMYSPTLAVWATSYLVGPGFAIGQGTIVTAAKVVLGPLPAVPSLAGLPSEAAPTWGTLLLGLPLAAGMTAGWLLVRGGTRLAVERRMPLPSWGMLLGSAVLAGPVAGVGLTLASLAATGPLGGNQLAIVGPRTLPVALAGAVIVAVGSVAGATATRLIVGRRTGR